MKRFVSSIRRRGLDMLALAAILILTWLPRSHCLGRYVAPDEPRWLYRSANFYLALAQGDFAATYQKEHPGVTVMWAGTLGFLATYPEYRGSGAAQFDLEGFHRFLQRQEDVDPLRLLIAGRTVMVVLNTLALTLAFWYARRLAGLLAASAGFALLALDPFHISLSNLLHLDGLLSSLMLLSLLAFLVYRHERRWSNLAVSAAAAGAAWLTKSPGLLLIPLVGLLALADLWGHGKESLVKRLRRYLPPLLAWGLGAALVCFVFWPALWIDPLGVISKVLGEAQNYITTGHSSNIFFDGRVYSAGQMSLQTWYFYPLAYLWRATPAVLLGLGLAVAAWSSRRPPFETPAARRAAEAALVFALLFATAMGMSEKKFDRYLLPVFPWLDLLAGLGWAAAARWAAARWAALLLPPGGLARLARRYAAGGLLLAGLLAGQAALLAPIFPYTHAYYNPWLGGAPAALEVMQIGWGEGLDQAAAYLNGLPQARSLRVLSWYELGPFSYFFHGRSQDIYDELTGIANWEQRLRQYDYAVIYVHQVQRNLQPEVVDWLARRQPVFTVRINGIDYAWVYPINP